MLCCTVALVDVGGLPSCCSDEASACVATEAWCDAFWNADVEGFPARLAFALCSEAFQAPKELQTPLAHATVAEAPVVVVVSLLPLPPQALARSTSPVATTAAASRRALFVARAESMHASDQPDVRHTRRPAPPAVKVRPRARVP